MEAGLTTTIQITDQQDIQPVILPQCTLPADLMTVHMQILIIREGGHRAVFRLIQTEPNRFKGVILKQESVMQGVPVL